MTFKELFHEAYASTDSNRAAAPYPYQERLAVRGELPQVLSVPTGVGKTAAVVLSWVYRRRFADQSLRERMPRRLVYCLPMRTLVEQTYAVATEWLRKLSLHDVDQGGVGVQLLMGGTDDGKWYEHPERDQILIGTQDMLLSRALNRGYGMSRYAWPVQYALLNNDCLWVLDETQLMGVGLTTSAQLAGFRRKLNTFGTCHTLWMSATLDAEALATIDHPRPESGGWMTETLNDDDRKSDQVQKLLTASKPCQSAKASLTSDNKKTYEKQLAAEVLAAHQPGTLTLVVMNRVARAQDVYGELLKQQAKSEVSAEVNLIHSRFRPSDRRSVQDKALNERSIPEAGRIVVATQAIEAGVDISATTMFTELAPWSSLVQRFGRCNRRGTCGLEGKAPAQVYWIDIDTADAKKAKEPALPYEPEQLDRARSVIEKLSDVGPQSLTGIAVEVPPAVVHVLRRKDLLELFDTTPDLSGNDLDVSRYIRDSQDTDVQVYWRKWERKPGPKPSPPTPTKGQETDFPAPFREELCAVGVGAIKSFLGVLKKDDKRKSLAWVWNPLDAEWTECDANQVRPGQVILLHCDAAGYDSKLGWTGDAKLKSVEEVSLPVLGKQQLEANAAESTEGAGIPLTVAQHLRDVGTAAAQLPERLPELVEIPWTEVIRAAWWHDVGKAHPAFQGAIREAGVELARDQLWAKSGVSSGYLKYFQLDDEDQPIKPERRGFRHELASALAWLQQHTGEPGADLVAYLIAAHHGKVRLSIRSMPNEEKPPANGDVSPLFARGIWNDDELPEIAVGNDQQDVSRAVKLDLRLMQLGDYIDEEKVTHSSWLARTLALRDEHGPFKLAYLETLVRVADWRGSNQPQAKEST